MSVISEILVTLGIGIIIMIAINAIDTKSTQTGKFGPGFNGSITPLSANISVPQTLEESKGHWIGAQDSKSILHENRKTIQILTIDQYLVALCDDGTMWKTSIKILTNEGSTWTELKQKIPSKPIHSNTSMEFYK